MTNRWWVAAAASSLLLACGNSAAPTGGSHGRVLPNIAVGPLGDATGGNGGDDAGVPAPPPTSNPFDHTVYVGTVDFPAGSGEASDGVMPSSGRYVVLAAPTSCAPQLYMVTAMCAGTPMPTTFVTQRQKGYSLQALYDMGTPGSIDAIVLDGAANVGCPVDVFTAP